MSGRGDNNKRGSAGRGSSNQSSQPFIGEDKQKANHGKKPTGGKASEQAPKSADQDANRNEHLNAKKSE